MEEKIFNSWDWIELSRDYFEHWSEYFPDDDDPPTSDDERCSKMAFDDMYDCHQEICSHFERKVPWDTTLILQGHLGLWNGDHDAMAYVTPKNALYGKYDDLAIDYENGEIIIRYYHHDGTNVFCLSELPEFEDSMLIGRTPSEVRNVLDVYDIAHCEGYMDGELSAMLGELTVSTVPYLADYLSEATIQDFKEREEKRKERSPIVFKEDYLLPLDNETLNVSEAGEEMYEWSVINQNGAIYTREDFDSDGYGNHECVFQLDCNHKFRCIGEWSSFSEEHKDDTFRYYRKGAITAPLPTSIL